MHSQHSDLATKLETGQMYQGHDHNDMAAQVLAEQLQAVSNSYGGMDNLAQAGANYGQASAMDSAAFHAMAQQQQQHIHHNGYYMAPTHYDPHTGEMGYHAPNAGMPMPTTVMQPNMDAQSKAGKGGAASLANDRELRDILTKNQHRNLTDVAAEVIATERTSKSEKTKQLFAMIWYVTLHRSSRFFRLC